MVENLYNLLRCTVENPGGINDNTINEDSPPQRRRGVFGKIFTFDPQTPYKRRFKESPQQRLWGIKNLIKEAFNG